MTGMSTANQHTQTEPAPDAAAVLADVYKRVVGIHASVEERLSAEPEIVFCVERELRDLMRYISQSGAAPLKPKDRPTWTEQPADTPG